MKRFYVAGCSRKDARNYCGLITSRNLSLPWRYHWQKKMFAMCISRTSVLPYIANRSGTCALASTDSISYDRIIFINYKVSKSFFKSCCVHTLLVVCYKVSWGNRTRGYHRTVLMYSSTVPTQKHNSAWP